MDVREERVQLAFPEDVITFRGNDAEINVNDAVTATTLTTKTTRPRS